MIQHESCTWTELASFMLCVHVSSGNRTTNLNEYEPFMFMYSSVQHISNIKHIITWHTTTTTTVPFTKDLHTKIQISAPMPFDPVSMMWFCIKRKWFHSHHRHHSHHCYHRCHLRHHQYWNNKSCPRLKIPSQIKNCFRLFCDCV